MDLEVILLSKGYRFGKTFLSKFGQFYYFSLFLISYALNMDLEVILFSKGYRFGKTFLSKFGQFFILVCFL